jgi:hypothetical protein
VSIDDDGRDSPALAKTGLERAQFETHTCIGLFLDAAGYERRRRERVWPSTQPQAECWVDWKIDPSPVGTAELPLVALRFCRAYGTLIVSDKWHQQTQRPRPSQNRARTGRPDLIFRCVRSVWVGHSPCPCPLRRFLSTHHLPRSGSATFFSALAASTAPGTPARWPPKQPLMPPAVS